MNKVYIAAPFFNPEQLSFVKAIERLLDEWHIPYFSPRKEGIVADLKNMSDEEKFKETKRIYDANINNIYDCPMMIAVIDDHDSGTMFEIGWAAKLKTQMGIGHRKIITVSNKNYGLNIMLMHAVDAHVLGIAGLTSALISIVEEKSIESQYPMDNLS